MSAMAEPGLARALQAMLECPSKRFTVEALASIAGMSRSAFAARFTQAFGRTPLNLLKSERLRRARELLATTNAPVDQIARTVGFSSRSHFSHAFRTAYGVDPSNFRAVAFGKSKSALE
jgi:transcriptional regulator GlxA family with amidase domain